MSFLNMTELAGLGALGACESEAAALRDAEIAAGQAVSSVDQQIAAARLSQAQGASAQCRSTPTSSIQAAHEYVEQPSSVSYQIAAKPGVVQQPMYVSASAPSYQSSYQSSPYRASGYGTTSGYGYGVPAAVPGMWDVTDTAKVFKWVGLAAIGVVGLLAVVKLTGSSKG